MTRRASIFETTIELLSCSTLSPTDVTFIINFCKTNPRDLNENGKVLKKQLNDTLSYCNQVNMGDATNINSTKKFIKKFIDMYRNEDSIRSSLMISLLRAFVVKLSGHSNQDYGTKVISFLPDVKCNISKVF